MKEYKIDKKLADKITPLLHPNQIKHLSMHKKEYTKFLIVDENIVRIVVRAENQATGKLEDMYDVISPELQPIIKTLENYEQ